MRKVILTADSTCDLGVELAKQHNVTYYPYHINLKGKSYTDNVDIKPQDLYDAWHNEKVLPKTAAISIGEFESFFEKYVAEGYDVVHITLGSGLTSSSNNCRLASEKFDGHVFVIDSRSLSTGSGLLVLEAAKRIEAGMEAAQVAKEVADLRPKTSASFVLDTLEFLHAGGRCSALAAIGANLLSLKPQILVQNDEEGCGKMTVGKKYRGKFDKVLVQYVKDTLENRDDLVLDTIFITHSGISQERIDLVKKTVEEVANFKNIYITNASCTISAHCGPNCLGVLFLTK